MHKTTLRYWICQVLGWGGWALFNFFFIYLFAYDMYFKSGEKKKIFIAVLLIEFLCNILATQALRVGLKKIQWIKLPTNRVIVLFIISVILTEFLSYYGAKSAALITGFSLVEYEKKEDLALAVSKEKTLNLANTDYFINDKNNPRDSLNYAAAQSIKRSTGWYRDNVGNWQYEDQHKGRVFGMILFFFLY